MGSLLRIHELRKQEPEKLRIEGLLELIRRSQATDPRDKIIAVLNIAADVGTGKMFPIDPEL